MYYLLFSLVISSRVIRDDIEEEDDQVMNITMHVDFWLVHIHYEHVLVG